ncbi:MAG: sigma-70 family RNA polymerase sigma factor [Ruminococcaceae bacterium]|nr:sigma-70 family RNA polymerase sigma factor [Oscillospiraceae bacterium]
MDSNDFERVFKRNNKRLFLIALSFTANQYDAEDILQNSFMKLLKTKTEFENDEHIDKWLTSVTVNESKNLLKSAFRKKSADFEDYVATCSFESDKSEDLFNAVMSLPKKLRTVIHLFYYEDMTIKEIADMLNIKQSAVKTRLCRARKQLKIKLGDDWNDE